jgi:N-methylhydantoinase A
MNASVFSIVKSYVSALKTRLQEAGYKRDLLIANCVGGMMPPDQIIEKPIYSVMSGPTLAPIAAVNLTSEKDVIVVDMGGTTFDVSALRDRQLVIASEAMIGKDLLGIPKVDVRSIGAGGGSIAWVDSGGLLRVGPQSAGAVPGPACYGAGGTDATVTDANVVLGIINPDYFLAGRMKLDPTAAEKAVARIADLLGISSMEAAYAIHTTCNHNMVGAIENITMNEGIDPRESYLVSGGGSTACHISEMAKVLGIRRFLIPKLSSALSAYGGLLSDVRFDEVGTLHTDQRSFAREAVTSLLNELRRRSQTFLRRAGIPDSQSHLEYSFTGRYKYQSWDIEVPFTLPADEIQEADVDMLVASFHSMHERIHTFKEESDIVEFTTWKVTAIGRNGYGRRFGEQLSPAAPDSVKPKEHRPIYVHELRGTEKLPVYDGNLLGAGAHLMGPCIIEEETTTIFLLPSMVADTDEYGNYQMTIVN